MLFLVLYYALIGFLIYKFLRLDCNPMLAIYDKLWQGKNRLRNKTVWVVGSSTGIGEQLAYQLAELHCKLILTSTTESKLELVKEECLKRAKNALRPDDILVLPYEISDFPKNDEAFQTILNRFGKLDLVCLNAGRFYSGRVSLDDFATLRKVFDINYFSLVYISKLVLRHWLETEFKGQILATSSMVSIIEFVFGSPYTATKKALNAFMRDASMQMQPKGISITTCLPGSTKTALFDKDLTDKDVQVGSFARMNPERCAELMIIGCAMKLNEIWVAKQPALLGIYFYECFSYYFCLLARTFNIARFEKSIFKDKVV